MHSNELLPISSKAILATLKIRKWTARKFDRTATREIEQTHGAQDAGRFNKKLIAARTSCGERTAFGALVTCLGDARTNHYSESLAWGPAGSGFRLLPVSNLTQYLADQREAERAYAAALPAFLAEYPELRDEAEQTLGSLYRDSDYPAPDAMPGLFDLEYERTPLPTAEGSLVDTLAAPEVQRVREEFAAKLRTDTEENLQRAMGEARARVGKVVRTLAATMNGEGNFKGSMISNVSDTVASVRRLTSGMGTDDELADMLHRIDAAMLGVDAQDLRDDHHARKDCAQAADAIVADMGALFGAAK